MKHYFLLFILIQLIVTLPVRSQYTIRLGIIGLDTSHSTAFVELINGKNYKFRRIDLGKQKDKQIAVFGGTPRGMRLEYSAQHVACLSNSA